MKIDDLRIEFDWLERQTGSPIERAFFADIGIAVGDEFLTRIDDTRAKTVRNRVRGCAYRLATWLAANWWRLRWEPEPADCDLAWRLAHTITGAAGGYIWPNTTFASDGEFIDITSHPTDRDVAFEPIRYLSRVHAKLVAADFERAIDGFVEAVLSRLQSVNVEDEGLSALWAEVIAERSNSRMFEYRKFEAMAGFDPDEAPHNVIALLIEDRAHLGRSALEEVAAEARHTVGDTLSMILNLDPSQNGLQPGGYHASMPKSDIVLDAGGGVDLPWQKAAKLARLARKQWGLGSKPVHNEQLAELLGTSPSLFVDNTTTSIKMPVAYRSEEGIDIYPNKTHSASRRFAACRLLGDHLYFGEREKLVPATNTTTSRQKFQRAFAQEFLCPFEVLSERMNSRYVDDDEISDAASYFDVSPLLIRTTLVNYGKIARDALASAT